MGEIDFNKGVINIDVKGHQSSLRREIDKGNVDFGGNWYMDKMIVSFLNLKPGYFKNQIPLIGRNSFFSRRNNSSIVRIEKSLFTHHNNSPQPDTSRRDSFTELILIDEDSKEALNDEISKHEIGMIKDRYGSPGKDYYACNTHWKTPKVHMHEYGNMVPRDVMDDLISGIEKENHFIAKRSFWYGLNSSYAREVNLISENKQDDSHYLQRVLTLDDIANERKKTSVRSVTNSKWVKAGDFLFVFEKNGVYDFKQCGMFDHTGKLLLAGKATVESYLDYSKQHPDEVVRIYDGMATDMDATFALKKWQEEFQGEPRNSVVNKLDRRLDAKPTNTFMSLVPFELDKFYVDYTKNKIISVKGFQSHMRAMHKSLF